MAEEVRNVPSQPPRIDRTSEIHRIQQNLKRRRIAFGIIGVFLLVIIGVLVVGYVVIFVRPPQQRVVSVNDVTYTRGDMVKLLRVRQRSQELSGANLDASSDVFQALQQIVENEIIAQTAPSIGINVSDEDLDRQIQATIAFIASSTTEGKSEEQVEREFKESYQGFLNSSRISEDEHREIVRRALLRERVRQFVGESIPRVGPQMHVYRLAIGPNDELDILQTKYNDMVKTSSSSDDFEEAFKNITREFSRDTPERRRLGGEMGWMTAGILTDYDDILVSLPLGELSDPVRDIDAQGQFVVFMISEREPIREISPRNLEILKDSALTDWINQQRRENLVNADFNSEVYSWMIEQLGISTSITPALQPDNPLEGLLGGGDFQAGPGF